jgi:hypothetical protein
VEYRNFKIQEQSEISTHVNAIDIALCLTELGVRDSRMISEAEENWFKAGYYLNYIFANSTWSDIEKLYDQMVDKVVEKEFFRK